jgi:carbamoyl-phosphate synthase small subunit
MTEKPARPWQDEIATAVLVSADGEVTRGYGVGATGEAAGEVCFNTAMTGYQEILTDPSYAGQIITFTFPHIGNVGANSEDIETLDMSTPSAARGCILLADITAPSNYRAEKHLNSWLKERGIVGICGIDTRALTSRIRQNGMPNAIIAHEKSGEFDIEALKRRAAALPSLENMDMAADVSCQQPLEWDETLWKWSKGYSTDREKRLHVVAVDFGAKRNILRCLASLGCKLSVVPADTSADEIIAMQPDGVFLSNGPGDPAATGEYVVPEIQKLLAAGTPIFGICLGHQILALALGARTTKMHQGHHGANHPVKDHSTGKVEITSMNHGFCVDGDSLPDNVTQTHVSLFDGTNCGLAVKDMPVFSVQHHPEASPGPQDSYYLFERFVSLMENR